MDSKWEYFVQSVLKDLQNGARIPEYFGCLIPLLTRDAPPVVLPNSTPFKDNQIDTDDDFISIDVVKPSKQQQKPKQQQNIQQQQQQQMQQQMQQMQFQQMNMNQNSQSPQQMQQDQYIDMQQPSSFSPRPWLASNNNKSPPPPLQESEGSYESPQKEESPPQSPMNAYEQNESDDYSHYAAQFREIGDSVYGKYWYPVTTMVPRMTLESKLMVTFKVSRFNRLKKMMTDAKQTSNKLRFSRQKDGYD
ncbi:hypothetical protein TRFO_12406 [Tritrichomonas foetus]|uniref:Uncharacterized protein n=1 Tax=Tritrichomonas foetus TaxID=1144522 RepID=A0A1J4L1P7_9EUKA|nr:hypothetical protein TRFO_12406 [Tritrichomonas foetus]|eukprot:OHT17441.1 hypothetical protein TRFO_12406 [Tritrichomonas foetus]